MEGYLCPNKNCKEELHWQQFQGMRLCREEGRKKIYNAYCPKCNEYMEVDEYNRKVK
jgi:hypothetical protein